MKTTAVQCLQPDKSEMVRTGTARLRGRELVHLPYTVTLILKNFLASQKMFLGWLRIFPSPIAYMGGGTSTIISLRVVCSRLVFGEVTSPNTRTSEELKGRV